MGLRGPLTSPTSTRGVREEKRNPAEVIQERIEPPQWVKSAKIREFFIDVIDRQIAAGVGVRMADAETYARYAVLSIKFRSAKGNPAIVIQRELSKLEAQLSIGEKERKRLGIKAKKQETNPMARLIAMPTATSDDVRSDRSE